MNSDAEPPTPHIQGLDKLFTDHAGHDGRNRFHSGSTVVISGPPGSGKTTMALALVRSMMSGLQELPPKDNEVTAKHIAYYISTEIDRERLWRMFSGRGWFRKNNRDGNEEESDSIFRPDSQPDRASGLHVINPPLEIERPVKTSEELVNFIVRQIAIQSPPLDHQKVFIIVDSLTALFKDSKSPGDSRRQTHELIYRLRQQFSNNKERLGMIILLAEQGIAGTESPGMETYVADFVFNLGLKSLSMGTRLRTLEVTKSQGANMMMGEHTWLIVTNESLNRVIAGVSLREAIVTKVNLIEGNATLWGTCVIMHRPYFYPTIEQVKKTIRKGKKRPSQSGYLKCTGIRGLDQMLKADPEYWFANPIPSEMEPNTNHKAAIEPGSVTIIIGESGTGKTSLSYMGIDMTPQSASGSVFGRIAHRKR